MRLHNEYFLSSKEKEETLRSYNKLKKRKIDLKRIIDKGGLRWVDDFPTHSCLRSQGFIKPEFRHKITETDLAIMLLECYPDLGGYCQIYPDNFFIVQLDFIPRTLELKKQKNVIIS